MNSNRRLWPPIKTFFSIGAYRRLSAPIGAVSASGESPHLPNCLATHRISHSEIPLENEGKYLVDWISNDIKVLFEKRLDRARYLRSKMIAIAFELGLSYHLYEVGIQLYESMFLGGLMTNMETWHNFGEEWSKRFEGVEQQLF